MRSATLYPSLPGIFIAMTSYLQVRMGNCAPEPGESGLKGIFINAGWLVSILCDLKCVLNSIVWDLKILCLCLLTHVISQLRIISAQNGCEKAGSSTGAGCLALQGAKLDVYFSSSPTLLAIEHAVQGVITPPWPKSYDQLKPQKLQGKQPSNQAGRNSV